MKILYLTAIYRRPAISQLFFMSLKRFIEASGHESKIVCATSDADISGFENLKMGIEFVYYKNEPLSEKWTAALVAAMRKEWDYLFITGSDDFFSHELWQAYKPYIETGEDYFGMDLILFYDLMTKRLTQFKYPFERLIGCGRMISRKCVEDCFPLWESGLNTGLDRNSENKILLKNYQRKIIPAKYPLMLDIKTKENIWKFNSYLAFNRPTTVTLDTFLTKQEQEFMNEINEYGIRNVSNKQTVS